MLLQMSININLMAFWD